MVAVPNGILPSQFSVRKNAGIALACWPERAMAAATTETNRTFLRTFLNINLIRYCFICINRADCLRHPAPTAAVFIAATNLVRLRSLGLNEALKKISPTVSENLAGPFSKRNGSLHV